MKKTSTKLFMLNQKRNLPFKKISRIQSGEETILTFIIIDLI